MCRADAVWRRETQKRTQFRAASNYGIKYMVCVPLSAAMMCIKVPIMNR